MAIRFKSERKNLEVLTPDGRSTSYEVEYRWDPLTSRLAVLCPHLKEKWIDLYGRRDEAWLQQMVEDSRVNCPFCPPTIDAVAARFSPRQLDEELLRIDRVYLFPNLFPRTDFEAVITSPNLHYLKLNEFSTELLSTFLTGARECIARAVQKNANLLYPVIGCNYLPSAGASLIHFHMQLSIQEFPYEYLARLINSTTRYELLEHTNFWLDLMKYNESREIERTNKLYWYTPFAPAGFCEVDAVIERPHLLSLTTEDIHELARGLSSILRYYHDRGFAAFNFILYSDRLDSEKSRLFSGLQIRARPSPRPTYLSIDTWYMPLLLQQAVVIERPEELARDLRTYF